MLWDLIRDFFVQLIFGGTDSNGTMYDCVVDGNSYTSDFVFDMGNPTLGSSHTIALGDWLSTTATMISITIIVVLCCLFVYKIVKLIGGLIR